MLIILALLLQLSTSLHAAEEKFICSALVGRSFYQELKPLAVTDKTKHCSLSCYLALRCGGLESFHVGLVKELMDVLGAGQAEWADLRANQQGITFALAGRARSKAQCLRECKTIYE
jgi:hypothetical protein